MCSESSTEAGVMAPNEARTKPQANSDAASAEETEAKRRLAKLTPRERQVVELIVAGKTTREISRELRVSARTIDAHRSNIMAKTGARRVAELVRLAVLYLPQADSRADPR